ncbi:unnamed protein product [Vitrella brassicaformis CCMP3155]|uniref:Uncharacterized protein n=1 Tax=Vitrella brassicaformis (strain CCMP3155) TaxID=1169540 RepID=A0A0G4EW15_VITBC|nr:unnamed protein product [Vitrella brassicaformis CCMP3155]|eukprot:CEM02412.1 unnamed protein product [Vitrella brassicaformis CCMP3155]
MAVARRQTQRQSEPVVIGHVAAPRAPGVGVGGGMAGASMAAAAVEDEADDDSWDESDDDIQASVGPPPFVPGQLQNQQQQQQPNGLVGASSPLMPSGSRPHPPTLGLGSPDHDMEQTDDSTGGHSMHPHHPQHQHQQSLATPAPPSANSHNNSSNVPDVPIKQEEMEEAPASPISKNGAGIFSGGLPHRFGWPPFMPPFPIASVAMGMDMAIGLGAGGRGRGAGIAPEGGGCAKPKSVGRGVWLPPLPPFMTKGTATKGTAMKGTVDDGMGPCQVGGTGGGIGGMGMGMGRGGHTGGYGPRRGKDSEQDIDEEPLGEVEETKRATQLLKTTQIDDELCLQYACHPDEQLSNEDLTNNARSLLQRLRSHGVGAGGMGPKGGLGIKWDGKYRRFRVELEYKTQRYEGGSQMVSKQTFAGLVDALGRAVRRRNGISRQLGLPQLPFKGLLQSIWGDEIDNFYRMDTNGDDDGDGGGGAPKVRVTVKGGGLPKPKAKPMRCPHINDAGGGKAAPALVQCSRRQTQWQSEPVVIGHVAAPCAAGVGVEGGMAGASMAAAAVEDEADDDSWDEQ